jgi:hypothetical protein
MRKMTPMVEALPVQPGRDIRECYDIVDNRPLPWYVELASSVKGELTEHFGLDFGA